MLVNYCVPRQDLTITCKGTVSLSYSSLLLDCHPTLIDSFKIYIVQGYHSQLRVYATTEIWIKAYLDIENE